MSQEHIRSIIETLQKQFILGFLAEDSAPYQQLTAPAGYGKTYLATEIILKLITENSTEKILILTYNLALSNFIAGILKEKITSIPVLIIDGPKFRELETTVPIDVNPLDQSIIAIMSIHFLRSDRIVDSTCEVDWDLVVVDEAHDLKPVQFKVIERLLQTKHAKKMLLLATTGQQIVTSSEQKPLEIEGIKTTVWERVIPDPPKSKLNIIDYSYSAEELRLIKRLKEILKTLPDQNLAQFASEIMLRTASSSLYALEQSLFRQLSQFPGISVIESDSDQDISPGFEEQRVGLLGYDTLSELLDMLDQVNTDSKFNVMERFIGQLLGESKTENILIVTTYASTLSYINSRLVATRMPVYSFTSSTPFQEGTKVMESFHRNGSILVSTFHKLMGLDLSFVKNVIIYDLFGSEDNLVKRAYALLARIEQGKIYLFFETSGILPYEQELIGVLTGE